MPHLTHALARALAVVLLAVATCGTAVAADSPVLDRILESRTLRVGMAGDQPPFAMRDRNGKLIGFEVDLARTLANGMEVTLEIVEKPFGELMDALDDGEVDMVMSGLTITPERARRATFLGPYLLSGKSLLTRSDTLARTERTLELNRAGLRLAALKGSTSQTFVARHLPQAGLVPVERYEDAVAMLKAGEIDALVADLPVCVVTMLRHPDAGFATLGAPLTVEPVGMAVSGRDPQFANLMENYLDAVDKTGILDQMRRKWLEQGEWLNQLP